MTDIIYDGKLVQSLTIHDNGEGYIFFTLVTSDGKKWTVGNFKQVP